MKNSDKPSLETIQELLAQRREEPQGAEYWQDFLREFHHSQRQKALKKPSWILPFSGLAQRISELGSAKWAYASGLAYAAVTAAFLLTPREVANPVPTPTRVNYETVQAPVTEPSETPDALELLTPAPHLPAEKTGF